MTLFFETAQQAFSFLAAAVLGFAIAACLCCGQAGGFGRILADILLLLSGGAALVLLLAILRDDRLRAYHLLGAACGAILYLCGCHALYRRMQNLFAEIKKEKRQESTVRKPK